MRGRGPTCLVQTPGGPRISAPAQVHMGNNKVAMQEQMAWNELSHTSRSKLRLGAGCGPDASRFLPRGFLEYWIRMPPRWEVVSNAPCRSTQEEACRYASNALVCASGASTALHALL